MTENSFNIILELFFKSNTQIIDIFTSTQWLFLEKFIDDYIYLMIMNFVPNYL